VDQFMICRHWSGGL